MIISKKHEFIFLHCRKAAGSSVSVSLCRYLGDDDILLGPVDDCISHNLRPPRRMITEAFLHPDLFALTNRLVRGQFWKFMVASNRKYYKKILGERPEHATAKRLQTAFPDQWSSYKKFCIVRNSWDQMVSEYYWRKRSRKREISFKEFIYEFASHDAEMSATSRERSNWSIYTVADRVVVDHTIRFEDLAAELDMVMTEIGVPWDGWLPNAKQATQGIRLRPKIYRDMYDSETKEVVRVLREKEIDQFHYSF